MLSLAKEIVMALMPPLFEAIQKYVDGGGDAEKLRSQPLSVSIAFGGGEGEAIKVQTTIESKLPDEI